MPASGNATWLTGDVITATKLNSIETALVASVAKAGDTMTGFLTLSADPTAALHAATKQYQDAHASATTGIHGVGASTVESAAGAQAKVDAHATDPTAAHAAAAISVTPTGGIASADVQAALAELDSEKAAVGHTHPDATQSVSGFMSAADKTKLDGIQTLNSGSYVDTTTQIGPGATVTLSIALGAADFITGHLAIGPQPINYPWAYATVLFGTSNLHAVLLSGSSNNNAVSYMPTNTSRRAFSELQTSYVDALQVGDSLVPKNVRLQDVYISGSNLIVTLKNYHGTTTYTLAMRVDWTVRK